MNATPKELSIFVSRALVPTSPLLKYLEQDRFTVAATSLIDFRPIAFKSPETMWLFFYSKTAVDMFLNNTYEDLERYKFCFFGKATATHFTDSTEITPSYVGNVNALQVAAELKSLTTDQEVTFIIGDKSLRSVQKTALSSPVWTESVVYDQRIKDSIELSTYDIAILTSPMNCRGFVENNGKANHYIAIGKTTQGALIELFGSQSIQVADLPNEEGIVKTLSQLITDRY